MPPGVVPGGVVPNHENESQIIFFVQKTLTLFGEPSCHKEGNGEENKSKN